MLSSVPYTGTFDGGDLRYTAVYNDDIYAFTYSSGNTGNIIQTFSIDTNKWSRVAYSGSIGARYGYAIVTYTSSTGATSLYIIGGWSASAATPLNDIVVYDFSSSSFSTVTTIASVVSFTARYYHSATLINTYIFVIGGVGNNIYMNDVSVYNMAIKSWALLATTGSTFIPRAHHTATYYNNVIYVIGGYNGGIFNDVMSLSIVTKSWTTVSTTGTFTARYGHSAANFGSNIYVIGGKGSSAAPVIDAINVFNILTSTWSAVPYTTPTPLRYLHSSIQYNGVIYILGGKAISSDASLNDVASFEIPGITITFNVTSNMIIPSIINIITCSNHYLNSYIY